MAATNVDQPVCQASTTHRRHYNMCLLRSCPGESDAKKRLRRRQMGKHHPKQTPSPLVFPELTRLFLQIFATTVGALSGATALVYMIWGAALEFRTIAILFVWDLIIFVQWVILSGLFGYMYIGENAEMDDGIQKMKTACYFDIVNMVLWMASAGYCGWVVFVADRNALSEGKKKEASSEEAGKKAAPQS